MQATKEQLQNPMRRVQVGKVVINMGIGKSGEILEKAKRVMEQVVGQRPGVRRAKKTIRDFGIHLGEPIGLVTTVRGPRAYELLKALLGSKEMKLPYSSFDDFGSCSFGIREHIEIPGVKYDPELGLFGMDVSVLLERPGYRVMRRKRARSVIGRHHRVTKEEAMAYFEEALGVEVEKLR